MSVRLRGVASVSLSALTAILWFTAILIPGTDCLVVHHHFDAGVWCNDFFVFFFVIRCRCGGVVAAVSLRQCHCH